MDLSGEPGEFVPLLNRSAPGGVLPSQQPRFPREAIAHEGSSDDAMRDSVRASLVFVLRDLLLQAERGALQLEVVAGLGLAAVLEHQNLRCALVVELQDNGHGLSPREMQIARIVANGATTRAIAGMFDISLWTVSTHLRRIFAKLGVNSRAEMVAQLFGVPHLPPDD